jgi:hypothetical protein
MSTKNPISTWSIGRSIKMTCAPVLGEVLDVGTKQESIDAGEDDLDRQVARAPVVIGSYPFATQYFVLSIGGSLAVVVRIQMVIKIRRFFEFRLAPTFEKCDMKYRRITYEV